MERPSSSLQAEYAKQVWQGAKDVILSTKTMMLLVNEGNGNIDGFTTASSQVAADTKQLIILMFNADDPPLFSQQFLFEATKALKTYILNLIKASKDCVLNPTDIDLRNTLDVWCRRVGEVLKEIMVVVQPPPAAVQQHPSAATAASPVPAAANTNNNNNNSSNSNTSNNNNSISNNNEAEEYTESESDASVKQTTTDNDDVTGEFSEEEEELDFVVNALNVFNALEDLRGVIRKGNTAKKFAKTCHDVITSASSLLDASYNSQSAPRLRAALESLATYIRQIQSAQIEGAVLTKLEGYVSDLEEAVGECVDEFRNSSNPFGNDGGGGDVVVDMRDGDGSPREDLYRSDNSLHSSSERSPQEVFGIPLEIVMQNQKEEHPGLKIPAFFRDAVSYLRREGLESVGLFKTFVANDKIAVIVNQINNGINIDWGGPDCDAYVTAAVLKRFLYVLPTPLCARKAKLTSSMTSSTVSIYDVQGIVQAMPNVNQHVLCELCALLYEVSFHAQINHMPTDALATAVGPLLFFTALSSDPVSFSGNLHAAVCIMIDHFAEVFRAFPTRSSFNMSRSASDIPPKSLPLASSPPITPQAPLTPQLRMPKIPPQPIQTVPPKASKKKLLAGFPKLPRAGGHNRVLVPPYRICVVGETATGKTALIHRMLTDNFIDYHEPTIEQKLEKTLVLEGDVYSVEMLDTSGSHIDNLAHQKWFDWGEGFIVMIDITKAPTFDQVKYWLEQISAVRTAPFPFMVVGSHMDKELHRECQRDIVENFLRPYRAHYVEYSAKFPAPNIHRILTIIIGDIQQARKLLKDQEKLKSPKKKYKQMRGRKNSKSSNDLVGEGNNNHGAENDSSNASSVTNSHKGFLLKWKGEKRRRTPPAVDSWSTKPRLFETWADTKEPRLNGSTGSSVPPLLHSECIAQGYNVETCRESITNTHNLDVPASDALEPIVRYYKPHFLGKEHANFYGEDLTNVADPAPVIISFLLPPYYHNNNNHSPSIAATTTPFAAVAATATAATATNAAGTTFSSSSVPPIFIGPGTGTGTNSTTGTADVDTQWGRAIVRTKKEDLRLLVPFASTKKEMIKSLIKAVPTLRVPRWTEVKDASFPEALAKFEENMLLLRYKFGVLLCLDGQTDESEMLSNKDSTPELEYFMNTIAEKVVLQGWKKFKGGLDVKENSTGTHSYYTEYRSVEVMFHVSTLLPFQDDDVQRVERKRHIGNDIVTLVFKSGPQPFSPATFTTKFTHVFIVVSVDHYDEDDTPYYRVAIANKPQILPYTPFLPSEPVLKGGPDFRNFILSKLINAERAALLSPEFRTKLTRTRKSLLDELIATQK